MQKKSAAAPGGKEAAPAVVPPAAPDNLEHAELPRWLEAMRPIQSVTMPTEDEERVESVGPLAGLRGVLSAEPVVAMPRRPGIMAGNIDASPMQLTLTETLRRLLIEPEVRASRKPVRAMLLTPLLRKAMSAVLILAILFPFFGGSLFSNLGYQPEANKKAGLLVGQLPADRPVLVAFEYDASTAPEIETGASALLEHLAQRGISVAFISSQPNGTMLGEGLRMQEEQQGDRMPPIIADFGYIPGGAGGLRRLSDNLRDTVNGSNTDWSQEPLASVHSLSDFSMILVLAASPQSVRDWVEQVHTADPNTPIVAMVSAASDALVFPYTEGSKPAIWGLVAGYAGAQAYRAAFLPSHLARNRTRGHALAGVCRGNARDPDHAAGGSHRFAGARGITQVPEGGRMNQVEVIGGMALGFFFTVAILSYLLLDDNLLFRLGAYTLVGVSAGYLMAVMLSSVMLNQYLIPLLGKPLQNLPILIILLVLGAMLFGRMDPRGSSLALIPMAFLVGVGAAVVVGGSLTGTFLPQAVAAAQPSLLPADAAGNLDLLAMLENWFVLIGTLTTLAYFHFSARPRGGADPVPPAGIAQIAQVGKYFLAVTLGALYAGALLSALAILVERIYFLIQTLILFSSGGMG